MNGVAMHCNHFSLLAGNGHIRISCSEQLMEGVTPPPHTVLLVPLDTAMQLCELIKKTRELAIENKVPGFSPGSLSLVKGG